MRRKDLLASGASLPLRMTPAERAQGRYMRAPDGHDDGTPAPSPTPSPTPSSSGFDFPKVVANLDGVPTPARPLYVQQDDGSYKYDDISALRSSLDHERKKRREATSRASQASEFQALGRTPEQLQELIDAADQAEQDRLTAAGDFDALKAQMETNHSNELGKKDKRIESLVAQITKMMVSDAARAVLAEKDVQGNPTLLMPAIRDRVSVTEDEDGVFSLTVNNSAGQPMLNAENNPATLRDLCLELRNDENYQAAFKGVNQSGGGTPNGSGPGGAPSGKKRSEMGVREKTAYIKEHGIEAYNQLPA